MKAIKQRLLVLRAARGRISQREVAVRLGMPVERYWRIENGYQEPTNEELAGIAKILRCSPEEIVPPKAQVLSC